MRVVLRVVWCSGLLAGSALALGADVCAPAGADPCVRPGSVPNGPFHSAAFQIDLRQPTGLTFGAPPKGGYQAAALVDQLIRAIGPALNAAGTETWNDPQLSLAAGRHRLIALVQNIRGIPVVPSTLAVDFADSGEITRVEGHFLADRELPRTSRISLERAAEVVRTAWQAPGSIAANIPSGWHEKGRLSYVLEIPGDVFHSQAVPQLVWQVTVPGNSLCPELSGWVNAIDGRLTALLRADFGRSDIAPVEQRCIPPQESRP